MIHHPHLEGGPFFWKSGPQGVLLVHGFTATVAEVRPLAEILLAAGFTVAGPLLPDHYTDPDDLNRVSWRDWTAAVETAYQQLASICQTVVVGGESTGGLLALHLGIRHIEIAALLLYAPALRLTLHRRDVARTYLAAPFVRAVPKQNLEQDGLWQGYKVNPLRGVIQLLALQRQVIPHLSRIRQPLLIVQGRNDTTVDPGVPQMIAEQASSAEKEIHWMDHSGHCVILDDERERVAEITLGFLHRICPANSPQNSHGAAFL
jgi:carboxylesterase